MRYQYTIGIDTLDKATSDDDKESEQKPTQQRQQVADQKSAFTANEVVSKHETDPTESESQSECLPACHVIARNDEMCNERNKERIGIGHDGGSARARKVRPHIESNDLRYEQDGTQKER